MVMEESLLVLMEFLRVIMEPQLFHQGVSGARPRNQMVQRLHNLDVILLYRPPTPNLKQRAKVGKIDEKLRVLKLVTFGIRINTANLPMCPHQVLIDRVFAKKTLRQHT